MNEPLTEQEFVRNLAAAALCTSGGVLTEEGKEYLEHCVSRYQRLASQVAECQQHLAVAEEQLAKSAQLMCKGALSLSHVMDERDALRLRITAVDAEHAEMERQKHISIAAFLSLERERDSLRAELANKENNLMGLCHKNRALLIDVHDLKSANATLKEAIEQWKQVSDTRLQGCATLQHQLSACQQERDTFKVEITTKENGLMGLCQQNGWLLIDVHNLKASNARLREALRYSRVALEKAAGIFDEHGDMVPYSIEADNYASNAYTMIYDAIAKAQQAQEEER